MPTLTVSGNEITDATRAAATAWPATQQGGSTDGAATPAGFGIWEAATNLFGRGQCDAVGGGAGSTWLSFVFSGGASTVAVDAATAAPFSPQSVKVAVDGASARQGVRALSATGIGGTAGTLGIGSLWFRGTAGRTYTLVTRWLNIGGTVDATSAFVPVVATGAWQLVSVPTPLAVVTSGDRLVIEIETATARAESFWVAHAMLQKGVNVVSPYVATSQGATATRPAARVQAPASLLNATQGWVAMSFRAGRSSASITGSDAIRIFDWRNSPNLLAAAVDGSNGWSLDRGDATGNVTLATAASFQAGDLVVIVLAWTSTTLFMSVNGAAFSSKANPKAPVGLPATFEIGDIAISGTRLDGSALWFACGTGTLTDADAAALSGLSTHPGVFAAAAAAPSGALTAFLPFYDSSYVAVPLPELLAAAGDGVLYDALVADGVLYTVSASDSGLYTVSVGDSL